MKVSNPEGDARLFAPAVERNRNVILDALVPHLPDRGLVLEISSGTGEHAVHLAKACPHLTFQPSDLAPSYLKSVSAWVAESGLDNLRMPVTLDVLQTPWPVEKADAVLNINMVHIAPWGCAGALMDGVARILKPGGLLYMYGPYKVGGQHTAPSNDAFDRALRAENPAWGVRNLEDVQTLAIAAGLDLIEAKPMPANNFSVFYRKRGGARD